MRALSIRNPYAHFILCEEKGVECRSWDTAYRGDFLVCSSASPKVKDTICGHALCVVTLESTEPFKKEHLEAACMGDMPEGKNFAWHLTNVRAIKPFAVKGKLNFFEVDDSLIEYLPEGDLPDEEAEELYRRYYEPLMYKG